MRLFMVFVATILATPSAQAGESCDAKKLATAASRTGSIFLVLDGQYLSRGSDHTRLLPVECTDEGGKRCTDDTRCDVGNRHGFNKFHRQNQDPKSPILPQLSKDLNEQCRRHRDFLEAIHESWLGLRIPLAVHRHLRYHMVRDVLTTMSTSQLCFANDGTLGVEFPFEVVNPTSRSMLRVHVGGKAAQAPVEVILRDKVFTLRIGKKIRRIGPYKDDFNYKALHDALELEHWERTLRHVHVVPSPEHRMEVVLRTLRAARPKKSPWPKR